MATTVELSDGGYVEYWVEDSGTSDPDTVHVQKHYADGSLAGPEYLHTTGSAPTVLALNNGGYILTTTTGVPGGPMLVGEVFGANGGHLSEFTAGQDPHIAVSEEGGFLVTSTFNSNRNFTHPDGLITLYDNDGHALTTTGRVYSSPGSPTVSTDADGVFHVTWNDGTTSHDLAVDPRNPPDLTNPAAPGVFYVDDVGSNTGAKAGGWTDDNTPTVRIPVTETGHIAVAFGTGDPGGPQFEVTADDVARGYKDIALSATPQSDGQVTFQARFEDADGLISPIGQMSITIDTQAPGQPTVSHVVDDQSGQPHDVANGGTTADFTPSLQIAVGAGTHAGDHLTVWDNGVQLEDISLSQASIDQGYAESTLNMEAGSHSITAQVRDSAGNAGATSDAFTFTVQSQTDHGAGRPVIGGDSGVAGGHQFYEKNLPNGTAPDSSQLTYSSSFTINSPDGVASLDIAGHRVVENDQAVFSGGPLTFTTELGETLSITGYDAATKTVSYTYSLDTAVHRQSAGQPPVTDDDSPMLTVVDHDGDTGHAVMIFPITDDEPRFVPDAAGVQAGATLTGNVLANDVMGADGVGGVANPSSRTNSAYQLDANGEYTVQGDYGVLHLQPDGDYSYVADAGAAAGSVDKFTFGVTDGDGSEARFGESLNITISAGPGGSGRDIISAEPGSTVNGTGGNDTIHASQGPDVITTGAGADVVAFGALPWNAGHITDFVVGSDKLDLSAIFQAAGYTGSDPVADGRMRFEQDNLGNTTVYFDRDQLDGGDWPFRIVTLDHVSANGLTWAELSTAGGASGGGDGGGGGSTDGQVITSDQYGDTLVGGAGDDTLNAGQGPDVMSGNGGADHLVWNALPWRAGAVTDFTPGVDKLDLRPLFQQAGYSGADPIGDHRLEFRDDGHGGTAVYFDRDDPNGGDWPFLITTLQGVAPAQIGAGDWLFR
jgi:hypothetical protein